METLVTWALINVVLPLVGTVVIGLVGKVAVTVNKKFHTEITQQQVANAVGYVEQVAANAIKAGKTPLTSSEKLEKAVDYVNKVIPKQDQETLKKQIEAAVNSYRANGNPCK